MMFLTPGLHTANTTSVTLYPPSPQPLILHGLLSPWTLDGLRFPGEDPLQQWGVRKIVHAPKVDNNNKKPSNPIWLGSLRPRQQPEVEEVEETNRGIFFTKPSTMAIVSLNHVVVQRVMRAHRLSTRAWRTSPSGHIPNKSSPFAKVLKHL